MTDYTELVKNLRITERICRDRMDGQVILEVMDAIRFAPTIFPADKEGE